MLDCNRSFCYIYIMQSDKIFLRLAIYTAISIAVIASLEFAKAHFGALPTYAAGVAVIALLWFSVLRK